MEKELMELEFVVGERFNGDRESASRDWKKSWDDDDGGKNGNGRGEVGSGGTILVIEGNAVYELDEECLRGKRGE